MNCLPKITPKQNIIAGKVVKAKQSAIPTAPIKDPRILIGRIPNLCARGPAMIPMNTKFYQYSFDN